jgi:hypothetical protein
LEGATVTAEIAIMNKSAVALAADSAVTISLPTGPKIYNTNKLFALSKHHPVGVMVYDLAEFMGVPWESVIKTFRSELKRKSFATLRQYVDHFLQFFRKPNRIVSSEMQQDFFLSLVAGIFMNIRQQIEEEIKKRLATGAVSQEDVRRIAEEGIKKCHSEVAGRVILSQYKNHTPTQLCHKYWAEIVRTKKSVFQQIPLPPNAEDMLEEILFAAMCSEWNPQGQSGIVFAGFGEDEIFPSVCHFPIVQVLDREVKHGEIQQSTASIKNSSVIMPFAQSEMAHVFMQGVDPSYEVLTLQYLKKMFEDYPDQLLNLVPGLSASQRANLLQKLRAVGNQLVDKYEKDSREYRMINQVQPVVNAISVLSKDMLAEVAESLVSLTSFKRRISITSAETVGGPIDVAVISKGDGFIWIKRKHYFKAEINHRYVLNNFGGPSANEKKETTRPERRHSSR